MLLSIAERSQLPRCFLSLLRCDMEMLMQMLVQIRQLCTSIKQDDFVNSDSALGRISIRVDGTVIDPRPPVGDSAFHTTWK